MRSLGAFTVGATGLLVADAVYQAPNDNLCVRVPTAVAGSWSASVEPKEEAARAPHRSLVALHESALSEPTWRVVETDLCCDSCDVVIADAAFHGPAWATLRRVGSGDMLIVVDAQAGGAKAVCCYDPWRCEVAVSERGDVVIGVRVRWYSNACERLALEYSVDGVVHWFTLADGGITLITDAERYVQRAFHELSGEAFEVEMNALFVPASERPAVRAVLERHGVRFSE